MDDNELIIDKTVGAPESLYTREVYQLFHSLQWPKGFRPLIVEEELCLYMVVFRDNFNSFGGEDRLQISMMVKEFMEKVRGMGIPIYMHVPKGDGRDETDRVRMAK